MGHRQNSFSIRVCLQCKGGGILVVKINLEDWHSPYSESIKVNAELLKKFPYVLHNIVAIMCQVPFYIRKGGNNA